MSDLEQRFDKALGAYLGLAIGDALGATVEFMRPREIQAQYGVHQDMLGGGWLKLARGQVTDDTTMSLALGDALVAGGEAGLRAHAAGDDGLTREIGHAFVRWWRGKPVDCGNTCRRGILRFLHEGTLAGPFNEGDAGNGALMRNLPVLLATLNDDAAFQRLSLAQSHLTHHHPLSDTAVLGLGQLSRLLLRGATHVEALGWVQALDWPTTASSAPCPTAAAPPPLWWTRCRPCCTSSAACRLRNRTDRHGEPGRRCRHHRRAGGPAGGCALRRPGPAAALAGPPAARHRARHHRADQRAAGPEPGPRCPRRATGGRPCLTPCPWPPRR